MFDFAGYSCGTNQSLAGSVNAFPKEYDALLNFEVHTSTISAKNFHLSSFSRSQEDLDQFQDDQLLVSIYGECYLRINENENTSNHKLPAKEIKKLFLESGIHFLDQIKGSFILFIHDSNKGESYFIADPLCLKSLYYVKHADGLVFASSLAILKNTLKDLDFQIEYDGASLIEYYLFDFILGDQTMLKDVRELQAGNFLKVANGEVELHQYCNPFDLFPLRNEDFDESKSSRSLSNILKKNVELFTEGPQKTALALTGGYDSRSIAALVGSNYRDYQYYSYGSPQSWDIKIPQTLARKNQLKYQFIDLSTDFKQNFSKYALTSIQLGDGIAEANRANYTYVYSNYLQDKSSIISGLFGSELIKIPTSRGLFIDENILAVLRADQPEQKVDELINKMLVDKIFPASFVEEHRGEVLQRILNNPFVCNSLSIEKKLFYFILMVGGRKYFSKEMKLERFYIKNKTPFFDLDFVQALLRTPFPWVYNWTQEKSLINNLKIHKVYANFIAHNKGFMKTISTHGFAPMYLQSPIYYPFLAIQFAQTKKKISRESKLSFDSDIKLFLAPQQNSASSFPIKQTKLKQLETSDLKNYVKLGSLKLWLDFVLSQKHA